MSKFKIGDTVIAQNSNAYSTIFQRGRKCRILSASVHVAGNWVLLPLDDVAVDNGGSWSENYLRLATPTTFDEAFEFIKGAVENV